jgi:ankyrin repeat protein
MPIRGHQNCTMHLLDRGGDVNVADARGGSLLHHAASKNHTEYGAAIIRRSAQVFS